ncbi:MAG: hypothetical protein ABSH49_22005, partial [Bryobacteraceae bacterium]
DKSWRYSSASNQRFGKLTRQVQGEVFFSLTNPYHGCPAFPPSFVIMKQHALTEALTTDRHFEQAGFRAKMLDQP